jgi:hypothetical protein
MTRVATTVIEPGKASIGEVMGRLHRKGYISDPAGKAKSVPFTEEGLRESERLFDVLFSL